MTVYYNETKTTVIQPIWMGRINICVYLWLMYEIEL